MLAIMALMAMSLRALVPAGYMLSSAAGGAPQMTLCTGMEMPAPGSDQRDPHDGHKSAPCVFAAVASLSSPEQISAFAAPLRAEFIDAGAPLEVSVGHGLAAPPPWATGPPRLA